MAEQASNAMPGEGAASAAKASFMQRLLAWVIDGIILGAVGGCLGFVGAFAPLPALWSTLMLAIPALYFVWSYSTSGQTLGKRALKIKVVSIDGSPLNWGKGVLRTIGYVLSNVPLGLRFLWPLWDADKQAGHDKIAGTVVVPASTARERLQGTIEPSEVRRRRRRWLIGLGMPALLMAVGFVLVIQRSTAEVRDMGPWPGPEVPAAAVATLDLSHLGLEAGPVQDARHADRWADGGYEDGILLTYGSGAEGIVAVWALRYETPRAAGVDYASAQAWAEADCWESFRAHTSNTGLIYCELSNGCDKLLWHDHWIVDIMAREATGFTPFVLVNQARDAMAAHWRAMQ